MRRERGLALVTVLWGLVILAAIAAVMLSTERISGRLAATGLARAQAEALVDAAVNRAVLGLLDPRIEHRWRIDGAPRDAVFKDRSVRVSIQDEYGKIDLNMASRETLQQMFVVAGEASDAADALADAVLDWREKGDLKRLNGAKAADYVAAGFDYLPRGGPFQTIDELQLVIGVTSELYQRLEPIVTVYSQRQTLNTQTAPRAALLSLPGMDPARVDEMLHVRDTADIGGEQIVGGVIGPSTQIGGWPFTIRVEVPMATGRLVREVAIRLTGDSRQPFWILATRVVGE